jgi:hypothetical protein
MNITDASDKVPNLHQESRVVAISTENPTATLRRCITGAPPGTSLQQLIDNGTLYIGQNLNPVQFATLQAIAGRILQPHHPERLAAHLDAVLQPTSAYTPDFHSPLPVAFDYQLGLDELDTIARTRTSYSFAELPAELQDAILSLISTGDLTTRKLDIASWLQDLQSTASREHPSCTASRPTCSR